MIGQENMNEIEQYVIDFIRSMRLNQKLSQRDLGNIIGVSQEFIRDVESKKRPAKYNLRHINALADYFNMSPKDFLPEKAFADNPRIPARAFHWPKVTPNMTSMAIYFPYFRCFR